MKLTRIATEGAHPAVGNPLGPFSEGLNFVYGEERSGKSAIRHLLRSVLCGPCPDNEIFESPLGHIHVRVGNEEFRLNRNTAPASPLQVYPIEDGHSVDLIKSMTARLNVELFDSIISFSLRDTAKNIGRLVAVLQSQLGVPQGVSGIGDQSQFLAWKQESNARARRLASLDLRIEELRSDRKRIENQLVSMEAATERQLEWDRKINAVQHQIDGINLSETRSRLTFLQSEIVNLKNLVSENERQLAYAEKPASAPDSLMPLFQRLDDIDNQIRRWRHVQTTVQSQRVRLKNEMATWDGTTLESEAHPYNNAYQILTALQRKVGQTDQIAAQWNDREAENLPVAESAQQLGEFCQTMRDKLQTLCQELSQQYCHTRNKSAAAELKHLRRCYHEMDDNIQQLVEFRDSVVAELQLVDPAGAEAVRRAEDNFCECALREGHMEARRKHVSPWPVPGCKTARVRVATPDRPEIRLEQLQREHSDLSEWVSKAELDLASLHKTRAQLVREREAMASSPRRQQLREELQNLDTQHSALETERRSLQQRVNEDRHAQPPVPNSLLVRAAKLLRSLTSGELVQVWIGDALENGELQVRDQSGWAIPFSALGVTLQNMVYLALAFAGIEELRRRGIESTILIDDAFDGIPREQVNGVLQLYSRMANSGEQVILMTRHQFIADRIPGSPVFELQPIGKSAGYPKSILAEATRESLIVQAAEPGPTLDWHSQNIYPLSKYPPVDSFSEYADRDSYIVPLPTTVSKDGWTAITDVAGAPGNENYIPVAVDQVGDQLGYTTSVDNRTCLDTLDILELRQLQILSDLGISTVGHLLDLDSDQLNPALRQSGIPAEEIQCWQSQLWMLCHVPGLRIDDARILIACGLDGPEHLTTSDRQQLFERIQRFFSSADGNRYRHLKNSISLERVEGWIRSASSTRNRWLPSNPRHRGSSTTPLKHQRSGSDKHRLHDTPNDSKQHTSSPQSNGREVNLTRTPRMRTPAQRRSFPTLKPSRPEPESSNKKKSRSSAKLRFYLDPKDHIEAAPSVGPKTAERFEKIGVSTVEDFLRQTSESLATKLDYKRMNAEVIRNWQHQARLVCRIPNLRGHDAQLLVACGHYDPEEISAMKPEKLFDIVGPFSETKEGLKIIRSSKKPDLDEIRNWIQWASQERSLVAA